MPTSASSATSALFKPAISSEGVAILLLIENSRSMVSRWPGLRDHVLPTLLGEIRIANQGMPIHVLLLVSAPLPDAQPLASPSPLREYYELPFLQFNGHRDNHISTETISRAIVFLSSVMPGQSVTRHMFIVAASSPSTERQIVNELNSGASSWQRLGYTLAQNHIRCHIIVNPEHDIQGFLDIFHATLFHQNGEQAKRLFSMESHHHVIRISCGREPAMKNFLDIPLYQDALESLSTAKLPQDVLYPAYLNTLEDASPQPTSQPRSTSPCLVSRLQQVHGMTKKKIYGAQPTRKPFFREDEHIDRNLSLQSQTSTVNVANFESPGAVSGSPYLQRDSHSQHTVWLPSSHSELAESHAPPSPSIPWSPVVGTYHTHDFVIPPPVLPAASPSHISLNAAHTNPFSDMNGLILQISSVANEPFIFSAESEAKAAACLVEAGLQSSVPTSLFLQFPSPPLSEDLSYGKSSSAGQQTDELRFHYTHSIPAMETSHYATDSANHIDTSWLPAFGDGSSSSSLSGWAG